MEFAAGKAKSCLSSRPDALVLGSDTLIHLGAEVLGKPVDLADAEGNAPSSGRATNTGL